MPSFLYQLIRWPSDGAPSMELQQSGFLKGSSGLGTILSIKYTSVTFLHSLEENVNSSMDNAHHPPATAWFHDLFVLLWYYFFTVYLFYLSTLLAINEFCLCAWLLPISQVFPWVPLTSGPCSSSPIFTKVMVLILWISAITSSGQHSFPADLPDQLILLC